MKSSEKQVGQGVGRLEILDIIFSMTPASIRDDKRLLLEAIKARKERQEFESERKM